ncbi:MarR family winged helix-turn-helix transcriptional regulator [Chelatococcus composti]|jgi:Transcriptional regulators|uniref:DNA-binding MarR family transcriptional regulator n=1 Tax=Chelatococcus composti TaxID=1743235 RepID=A0A841KJG1_9HYPH|nr:MarR family transcriptional regulator [Chelatococcus composti]MBB6169523.1 DNA-binding MarR family transcriptional regulator [Chelatococcus composti]MBS7736108.1 MarR family transcriptional regulator [Chelatococcus composti]PZN42683.1 MAG: MarR family transcriptional regulator [Pseudomonadota bacterium]GGG48355.1 MarR family transcriptional regulator [Chelatococcus composti]
MTCNDTFLSEIFDVARLIRAHADRRAREHGMSRAQWIILLKLDQQPGLSQQELADLIEVEPISIGRLVDRLADRGLVERRRDPKDRRVWRLHLLPAAEPILRTVLAYRKALLETVTEGIPEEALADLSRTLLTIKNNLAADMPRMRRTADEG